MFIFVCCEQVCSKKRVHSMTNSLIYLGIIVTIVIVSFIGIRLLRYS